MSRTHHSRRNVLLIVQNLPVPFDRRVWQEAQSLKRAGFGVAVICPKSDTWRKSYERLEDIDIYRYPLLLEADQSVLAYFFEFVYCWLASLWLALKAFRRCPFHVIHACNPPDTFFLIGLLFRPLGIKFVFDHHDLCPDLYIAKCGVTNRLVHKILLLLEWLTLRTADMVIATNESYKRVALTRAAVPSSKVVVIRSAPCRSWGESACLNIKLKEGRKYLVVFSGQIGKQDGIDYLLSAIRDYCSCYGSDTLFAIVGGGPSQLKMQRLAADLGVQDFVRFSGRVSDEQLCSYLASSDLCVDPSPWSEFSNASTMNKIVEYMALGKPIIAFDLLEHRRSALEAARYISPNDTHQFAIGIRELLLDDARRHEMSTFARARFESMLAWELSEERLLAAYGNLTDRGHRLEHAAASHPHTSSVRYEYHPD